MDIEEKIIIEEIRKATATKFAASDEPCLKCAGKTPMEARWNMEAKDKPVEA